MTSRRNRQTRRLKMPVKHNDREYRSMTMAAVEGQEAKLRKRHDLLGALEQELGRGRPS